MANPIFAANTYANTLNLLAKAGKKAASTPPLQEGVQKPDFSNMVSGVLNSAVQSGKNADAQVMQAVAGKGNVVEIASAVMEAEALVSTLVPIRDKLIAAYEEIMRMPV
jgi:flagellar hook-basal body complex protein FliE